MTLIPPATHFTKFHFFNNIKILIFVFLLHSFGRVVDAQARTRINLSPGGNIQNSILDHPDGSTFVLGPGTYADQYVYIGAGESKSFTLECKDAGGNGACILSDFRFDLDIESGSTVEFKYLQMHGSPVGTQLIALYTIGGFNLNVVGCIITGYSSKGIFATSTGTLTVTDTVITKNGGGIYSDAAFGSGEIILSGSASVCGNLATNIDGPFEDTNDIASYLCAGGCRCALPPVPSMAPSERLVSSTRHSWNSSAFSSRSYQPSSNSSQDSSTIHMLRRISPRKAYSTTTATESATPSLAPIPPSPELIFCVKRALESQCSVCAPYHNIDYCNANESFQTQIKSRTEKCRNDPVDATSKGHWFHYLEDKVAAALLSIELNVLAPSILCCVTNSHDLATCFNSTIASEFELNSIDGVMIKATNFHSNQGVFVLVPNPDHAKEGLVDLLTGNEMTYEGILATLDLLQATKIIVEKLVSPTLHTEYKFHFINGTVAAVDIIAGRDTDCPCYAVVDTDSTTRLDHYGCFEPGGMDSVEDSAGFCTFIDFATGKRRAGPVKTGLHLCESIPDISPALWKEMMGLALTAGTRIGVAIRIDMFVANGMVYVQEYTTNHMNGIHHCAAKYDVSTGCIDSCFMGRMWNGADGGMYGGLATPVPVKLDGFMNRTAQEQCDLLIAF